MADSSDPPAESERPPSQWWWLKWLGFLIVLFLIAWGGRHAYYRRTVGKGLHDILADLDRTDPGWRLQDVEEARPAVPDVENGALVSTAAAGLLPTEWPPRGFHEALEKLDPTVSLDETQAAALRKELDDRRPALEMARRLAGLPNGRHKLEFRRNLLETFLPTQQKVRTTALLLRYDALLRAHDNDMKGAMSACRAVVNAGRSLGDEPLTISQLIRIACVSMGCQAAERVLAQGEPTPEDLESLQRLLQDEDGFPIRDIALRGERAVLNGMFEALESGRVTLDEIIDGDRLDVSQLERLLLRASVDYHREHALALSLMNRMVALKDLPPPEQAVAEKAVTSDIRELAPRAFLVRLLFPALEKVSEACRREQAQVRCLIVALAAERYRQAHGDWPATLEKLVPEMLKEVPLDAFDGEPLRYKRLSDGVIVYSVGVDGVDNGGTLDRENPTRPGADIGCRLWDVKHRRQPPPPKPKPADPDDRP
jgi:hypothetical protein